MTQNSHPSGNAGNPQMGCRVLSNRNVATFIKELVLELPAGRGGQLQGRRFYPD
jgi:Na+-transporting NADH:ubiquinone oxidoreductase subunit NqrF